MLGIRVLGKPYIRIIFSTNNRRKTGGRSKPAKQQQQQQRHPLRNRPRQTSNGNRAAEITGVSNGLRVRHTEYITGISQFNSGYIVNGIQVGTNIALRINPGDGQTFPWLSKLSRNFDRYTIRAFSVEYQPTVGFSSSGGIALSCEYDPANPLPISLAEFLNKPSSVKGQVASYVSLRCKFQQKEMHLRHRHALTHDESEIRHADAGIIYCILYNIGSIVDFDYGELKISYDIVLSRPTLTTTTVKSHMAMNNAISYNAGATVFHPALGNVSDDKEYFGVSGSTLGVQTSHNKDLTNGGFPVESTRLHFEEPFTGRLHFHTGSLTGSGFVTPPGLVEPDVLVKPATDQTVNAITSVVKTFGDIANGVSVIWNIVAKAGDVIDLALDQVGAYVADGATLELAEMAAPLLLGL